MPIKFLNKSNFNFKKDFLEGFLILTVSIVISGFFFFPLEKNKSIFFILFTFFLFFLFSSFLFLLYKVLKKEREDIILSFLLPLSLVIFYPDIFREDNSFWALKFSLFFVVIVISSLLGYLLSLKKEPYLKKRIVLFSFLGYGLLLYLVFLIKHFNFGFVYQNTATIMQSLWTATQGYFFYTSLWPDNYFNMQYAPFLFLLIPLYKLLGSIYLLYFLADLAIVLSGILLFSILKENLGKIPAFFLSLSYLFHQSIYNLGVKDLFLSAFLPLFFMFSFWSLWKKKKLLFILGTLLWVSIRHDVSLGLITLGIYAGLRKRGKFWIIFPVALGLLWFFTCSFILSKPSFFPRLQRFFTPQYLGLGTASLKDFFKTLFTQPHKVSTYLITLEKIKYIYLLLLPFGFFLPFLSLEWIIALPQLGINLLSSLAWTHNIEEHYSAIIVVFFALSAGFSLAKLSSSLRKKKTIRFFLSLFVFNLAFLNFLRADLYGWVFGKTSYAPRYRCSSNRNYTFLEEDSPHNQSLWKALSLIDNSSSLYLPRYLLAYKAHRFILKEISPYSKLKSSSKFYKYVLIDRNTCDLYTEKGYATDFIKNIGKNENYQLIFKEKGVLLYKLKE